MAIDYPSTFYITQDAGDCINTVCFTCDLSSIELSGKFIESLFENKRLWCLWSGPLDSIN